MSNFDFSEYQKKSRLKKFTATGEIRISFFEKLASFTSSGVPVMSILKSIMKQKARNKKEDPEYHACLFVFSGMNAGLKFSEAIKPLIPSNEYLLLAASEKSGELPSHLLICANNIKDKDKITKTIKGAVTYPSVMLCMLIGLFYGLANNMLPTLVSVAPVSDWSSGGQLLYSVSNSVKDNILFVIFGILGVITVLGLTLTRLVNDFRVTKLDKFQPYKIYRDIQASFFLLTMGSLLKSGIKTSDALQFLKKSASPYTAFQIDIMIKRLAMGMQAGSVIATPFLGDSGDDIELYGQSSQFDRALTITAETSKIKLTEKIESVSAGFGTIMFVIVGASAVWGIQSFLSISGSIAKSMSE